MSDIRKAVETDEKAVFSLAVDVTRNPPAEHARFRTNWLEKLRDDTSYIAVAGVEGKVVGYISGYQHSTLYSNKPVAWIDEIVVREDFRKRGIGKKLMDNFSKWAIEKECRLIALASQRCEVFYRALGYIEDTSKNYILELPS